MLNDISYKLGVDDIKSKIRENYLKIAHGIVLSGEYSAIRRKRIFKILLYSLLYIFICYLLIKSAISIDSEDLWGFGISFAILAPVFIGSVICFQNLWLGQDIKKLCVNKLLSKLANIQWFTINDKFFVASEKKGLLQELSVEDIKASNLFDNKFTYKTTDDIFKGNYNGNDYLIHELNLLSRSRKSSTIHFSGLILKTKYNSQNRGSIEIETKESQEEYISKLKYIFIFFSVITFIFILPFLITTINTMHFRHVLWGFIPVIILSIVLADINFKKDEEKRAKLKREKREAGYDFIDEKFNIRTSSNISDVRNIITPAFADILTNLKQLFMSNEIKCKFYDGNIMLAISTRENLFETGSLLKPPTHPKVAERFISQLAGILIFMDYIATEMNKH